MCRMVGQRTACGPLRELPGAHDRWMAPLTSSFPGARTLGEGKNVTFADGNSLFLPFEAIDHDENFICTDCGIDTH